MKSSRNKGAERKQPTPQELLDDLCQFTRKKFYPDDPINFNKDRPRLLSWVLLYPASWLDKRGVTLPPERYKAILINILLDAVRFGQTGKVNYRPAWLRMVIQSHFRMHGEEYYEEAKTLRNVVEHTLLVAGKMVQREPDPVRELAQAARLLKPRKTPKKAELNAQLNLL